MPAGTDLLGIHLMLSGTAVAKLSVMITVMPSLSASPWATGIASNASDRPATSASFSIEASIPLLSRFDLLTVSPRQIVSPCCDREGTPGYQWGNSNVRSDFRQFLGVSGGQRRGRFGDAANS